MNRQQPISEELIHAFVDGELDPHERQQVILAMAENPEIAREVDELQKLKELIMAARPDEKTLSEFSAISKTGKSFMSKCTTLATTSLAASILLGVLLLMNNMRHDVQPSSLAENSVENITTSDQSNVQKSRVLLHVNRNDTATAAQLFEKLNSILSQNNKHQRIEVVASGPGLSLLRAETSPFPEKIRQIRSQHDNVVFIACQTTLNRLMMKINRKVPLLPEAMLTASGPELIKLRKAQGWKYINI